MIKFDEAKKKAVEHIDDGLEVIRCTETKDLYVFYFGINKEPVVGIPMVVVAKKNGELHEVFLPSEEGFEIINTEREIE